ncbi:MAG: cytochrome c biogenesis protein CcsA [Chitinophagales bacterium]|nr:cytochrome c biogenesis protein CcsA [Chitinophagales bacterium]
MLKILKATWWKFLSIPLLIYIVAFGLLQPIAPGISSIHQDKITIGEVNFISIETYNTHLEEAASSSQAWLKNGETFICGVFTEIKNNTAIIGFPIARKDYEKRFFDLIINNDIDGTFELRDALVPAENFGNNSFSDVDCKVEVNTNESAFFTFPNREILKESIRNLFFHVCMWFAMVFLLIFSLGSSVAYLNTGKKPWDTMAHLAVVTAMVFGALGILTGMVWAKFTWGAFWPNDPKLNGVLVAMLAYLAYLILRGSAKDESKKGRLAAVYNIFAFVLYIIFIYVIPKFSSSLHPGMGGNPAFSEYDLDSSLRIVFYPAVIAWTLLAFWLFSILLRIELINEDLEDQLI